MYFKIILLGEPRVGKTTIRRKYMGKNLKINYIKTLGFDFSIKKINGQTFQIWDIAGETTENAILNYMEGASAAIIMFDVVAEESLMRSDKWINLTKSEIAEDIPILIIGNKIDLRNELRGIDQKLINTKINDFKILIKSDRVSYIETSALTGVNVENAFEWLLEQLKNRGAENE